jgi:hypothetical protein
VEAFTRDLEPDNALRYIYNVPRLLQRGRMLCYDSEQTERLSQEIAAAYEALTDMRHELRYLLDNTLLERSLSRFQALSGYAFTLSVCSVYHCILKGPKFRQSTPQVTGEALAKSILCLAQEVKHLSPLGSGYMFLALPLAWLCAEDAVTKLLIRTAILDLLTNYGRGVRVDYLVARVEELRCDLQFETEALITENIKNNNNL